MSVSVTMPQLGESVTEGTVTRWLKQVGDTITADEPLLEISTDKVDTEIPAPASGVLLEIRALEDEVVQVGGELAVIGVANESVASAAPAAPAPVVEAPVAAPVVEAPAAAPVAAAPTASGATFDVVLPQLGESVTEGTVTRWLKQVGDTVAADEALVEISTDKVDTELPAPAAGVLLSINVPEDTTIAVGSVLGIIGSAATATATPVPAAPAPTAPPAAATPAPTPAATPNPNKALNGFAIAQAVAIPTALDNSPAIRVCLANNILL
jgi:2-oxoglutarate dehydrogenase E2 component (dihydrolipoamide succinyltransferase)